MSEHQLPLTDVAAPGLNDGRMVTLRMNLNHAGHELALAIPEDEWTRLVSNFMQMPADERQRVGMNIRHAAAHDPFPADDTPMDLQQQERCDAFVSDCVLLAALAEAVGERVLSETAVDRYEIIRGNLVKPRMN